MNAAQNLGPQSAPPLFRAGTLSYTRFGLVMLFFWLLWGHFVYMLMESVPGLLPLLLREHKATNTEVSFITTSLNVIGNMLLNPIISVWSDRHRGRFGRRRPFIAWTTPMVVACLILIPYGPDLAAWASRFSAVRAALELSPIVPGILFIAVFVMGFQVFDVFVGSTHYYLVRDTVPEAFLGRFLGWFKLGGGLAPLCYNLFVFPYAETHMKTVFTGVAVFYGLGITLMCWNVKEGEFPPPEEIGNARISWGAWLWNCVRAYAKDCFQHPIYRWTFLAAGMIGWSAAANAFGILFYRKELGVSMAILGKAGAVSNVIAMAITLPAGYLLDRWNYFRLLQIGAVLMGLMGFAAWFLLQDVPTMFVFCILDPIPKAVYGLALMRVVMAVYPKEKYGQFGSAGAVIASLGTIIFSILAAKFVDAIGCYRAFMLWQGAFLILAGLLFLVVERHWKRLGGAQHYKAP